MQYKAFLWIMRILAVLSLAGLIATIFILSPYGNQNPERVIVANVILLEASLFLALFAGFSLFLFWLRRSRRKNSKKEELDCLAGISSRQGFLLALATMVLLVFQSFGILTWWDGLLAIGAIILVELYFLAK